ncbi:Oidioi.mRNA.OKI2018_I69.chr1.g2997.t1.cds [Oikopleura dioica]|uniref:Oidioi.mRNA.OKI2018_I69.chr1.g2997.t1.cds n=1 Tax=Oikopleura dioica TaxID=34765 RepID=A0ABN7SWB4_OIKDI|nr:Oidioi.mRNA.OKI2018_I69.chr1.g2997.t1.cds [Oikopleura dioica]
MDADSSLSDMGIDYSFDDDEENPLSTEITAAPTRQRIIWEEWGQWTPCDRTCDEGHRERFRTCQDRDLCPTGSYETEECDLGYCARMTGWSLWTPCSASCGKGNVRTRKNYCDRIGNYGKVCPEVKNMTDVLIEKEPCLASECPYFAQWSVWSSCEFDGPCPFTGGRNRTRKCNFGSVGDEGCIGDLIELEICHHDDCGYWSEWEPWSKCTATCDAGKRARQRICINGKIGDVGCPYDEETDLERCNDQACPKWSVWSSWSECESECGPSLTSKSRVCLGAPFGSNECPGISEKTKICESKCLSSQKCEENVCVCNEGAGWVLDTDLDECVRPQPCLECHDNAVCNVDMATCHCNNGYEGDGYRCFDYNECALKLHNCDELAKCKNTEGGYECICPNGFESDSTGNKCLDINECSRGTHNCHAPEDWAATGEETRVKYGLYSSTCTNKIGGFECECLAPEFYGNGTHCEQAAPSIMAAAVYQLGKKLVVEDNARRTIDIDTCGAIDGTIEVSVLLAGKAPFNIEVDTIANPYAVTALNNVIFDSPFEMRLRIEGITSEPLHVDDEIYLVNVSDYQYSTEFKGSDLPIKANTTTQFQLRIGNRKCLQLSKFSTAKSVNSDSLLYQKFVITIDKPSSSPIFGHIIKKLHLLSESFFQSDFRFLATETIGIRSIGNATSIDSVFIFESDDAATNAKSVPEITKDFVAIFLDYVVEEFALNRESVKIELLGEAKSPSGVFLILLTAVFGIIIISASSFISFCTWPTNFTVLNESGRTEADSQSVISFLSGPLILLLEATVTSWVWVDYSSFGAPFLTKSEALSTCLLISAVFGLVFLIFFCICNVIRARYAAELVNLHFTFEVTIYLVILILFQLPSNFFVYFYSVRFKNPASPMPTSYIIKPLPMFISWLLLITTTVPKFVDYLHISRSFCTKMHLSAMVFMMLLFSPVGSLVQLISTVFTSQTVTIAESFNHKRTVVDGLKLQNALSLLDSMENIQNHYGEDPRLVRPTDYLMEWYSNRHYNCVYQSNMNIYGMPFSNDCLNPFDWMILITSIGQICAVYAFCYFFNRLLNVIQQIRNV